MIPELAWMIGAYIITRMTSYLLSASKENEHPLVMLLAGITIFICLFVVFNITQQGVNIGAQMK